MLSCVHCTASCPSPLFTAALKDLKGRQRSKQLADNRPIRGLLCSHTLYVHTHTHPATFNPSAAGFSRPIPPNQMTARKCVGGTSNCVDTSQRVNRWTDFVQEAANKGLKRLFSGVLLIHHYNGEKTACKLICFTSKGGKMQLVQPIMLYWCEVSLSKHDPSWPPVHTLVRMSYP